MKCAVRSGLNARWYLFAGCGSLEGPVVAVFVRGGHVGLTTGTTIWKLLQGGSRWTDDKARQICVALDEEARLCHTGHKQGEYGGRVPQRRPLPSHIHDKTRNPRRKKVQSVLMQRLFANLCLSAQSKVTAFDSTHRLYDGVESGQRLVWTPNLALNTNSRIGNELFGRFEPLVRRFALFSVHATSTRQTQLDSSRYLPEDTRIAQPYMGSAAPPLSRRQRLVSLVR